MSASTFSDKRTESVEDEEDDDADGDFQYYYGDDHDAESNECDDRKIDPEFFEFDCLTTNDVERLLNETVESLTSMLPVTPSLAKVLLHIHRWDVSTVAEKWRRDSTKLLVKAKIKPPRPERYSPSSSSQASKSTSRITCHTCMVHYSVEQCQSLDCGHYFCRECWSAHLEFQITQGNTIGIECMAQACFLNVPEEIALSLIGKPSSREKYVQFAFTEYVKSHPQLRFCPGVNCNAIIRAKERHAKRVTCNHCKTIFCFKCGGKYHAPTDCDTTKKWLTKCADDSETANYISANTKDCPKCHICIEKNGGCNHLTCYSCKHDFCWMCLGDWKTHGSEYYECSRYKENPNIATESAHAQAREALKKYLFYYERWENHSRSLLLEEQTLQRIKERINQKVMENKGTWIDWQYLIDAASLLAKCRYTLQYTYPFAYYLESGPRKQLFEYQQAQLEAEIENLSWKVERAETTDRGDLENQMDIAEKRRATLLKDFLPL
ncbi:putative E3 ubiquitin-protein ligase ariadne-2 [Halotydeus destructor]|nr:putative E3 ubiquitin-protein ligase ariadne-2 [Halotydeus destructor]